MYGFSFENVRAMPGRKVAAVVRTGMPAPRTSKMTLRFSSMPVTKING